jgi:hypothetical protein
MLNSAPVCRPKSKDATRPELQVASFDFGGQEGIPAAMKPGPPPLRMLTL